MVPKLYAAWLTVISSSVLSGCSMISNHQPRQSNYAVSFSIDNTAPFLRGVKGEYQTQFDVNVSNWSQNYDKKSCEVFLIVTDKNHVPVTDLETNSPNQFSYGGWFNRNAENPVLESLGLQPFPTHATVNNWFNVGNTSQAASKFIARTNQPVPRKDWRFVIMGLRGNRRGGKVLWTKVVPPSNVAIPR
ncbi:hypothetical protein [Alicyclobacillus sp. SO9]|uniref:hypothetical protein n=1 Tax=Alicyclobacillus sp. SO9 TaxID=2665646 RepID=UPI0018E7EAF7|nr:hypothetical protein [Alicyclobacillus sp. SO9]QQE79763.1 hypothetical protein GI364_04545 [Alicyclobacillus sp. SO9]